jgi:hypothetical protein
MKISPTPKEKINQLTKGIYMIRQISTQDKTSITIYLARKLNISLVDANIKTNKIIKSGLPAFILEDKDLEGICWVELRLIGLKKEKFIEILCNNWRLAESYIQVLRWNLNGDYFFSVPKHDWLNRTLNKNGIRFYKIDELNNLYIGRFEKRNFFNYKSDDNEE